MSDGLAQEAGESVFGISPGPPGIHSDYSGNSGSSARSGRVPGGGGGVWRNVQRTLACAAGVAVNHDLHGAARAVRAGQKDAFLDLAPSRHSY